MRIFQPRLALRVFLLFVCTSLNAQTNDVWPELNFYKKLNAHSRFFFIAKATRANGDRTDIEIGPNIDFYIKPPIKWGKLVERAVDESKSRPLLLRVGYRYLPSSDGPNENRGVIEFAPRFPLKDRAIVIVRERMEFRFIEGEYSWRLRSRLMVEKDYPIRPVTITPYIRVEAFYDSRYQEFSRTALSAGNVVAFNQHWELEAYYEHWNDTGKSPNQQVNGLGLLLSIHF